MRGVITMNEEYETRFLCNSSKVRLRGPAPRPPPLYHSGVWASPEEVGGRLCCR